MNIFLQRLAWLREASQHVLDGLRAQEILNTRTASPTIEDQKKQLADAIEENMAYLRRKAGEIDIKKTRSAQKKKVIQDLQQTLAVDPSEKNLKKALTLVDQI